MADSHGPEDSPPPEQAEHDVQLFQRVCTHINLNPSLGRHGEQRQSNTEKYTRNGPSGQPEWYSQEEKILAVLKLRVREWTNERIANLLGPVFDMAELPRSFSARAIADKWSQMTGPEAKLEHDDFLAWATELGPRGVDDIRELVGMGLRIWDEGRRVDVGWVHHGDESHTPNGPGGLRRNDSLAAHTSQSAAGLSATYTPSVAAERSVSYRCTRCQHPFALNMEIWHRLDFWTCPACGGRILEKPRIGRTIQYEAR